MWVFPDEHVFFEYRCIKVYHVPYMGPYIVSSLKVYSTYNYSWSDKAGDAFDIRTLPNFGTLPISADLSQEEMLDRFKKLLSEYIELVLDGQVENSIPWAQQEICSRLEWPKKAKHDHTICEYLTSVKC